MFRPKQDGLTEVREVSFNSFTMRSALPTQLGLFGLLSADGCFFVPGKTTADRSFVFRLSLTIGWSHFMLNLLLSGSACFGQGYTDLTNGRLLY